MRGLQDRSWNSRLCSDPDRVERQVLLCWRCLYFRWKAQTDLCRCGRSRRCGQQYRCENRCELAPSPEIQLHFFRGPWRDDGQASLDRVWAPSWCPAFGTAATGPFASGRQGRTDRQEGVAGLLELLQKKLDEQLDGITTEVALLDGTTTEAAHIDGPTDTTSLYDGPAPDTVLLDGPVPDAGAPVDSAHKDYASPTDGSPIGTWSTAYSGTTQDLKAVFGCGPKEIYAVGQAGTLLHYNGAIWTSLSSGTTHDLLDSRQASQRPHQTTPRL